MSNIDYGQSLFSLLSSLSRGKDTANAGARKSRRKAGVGDVFSAARRTHEENQGLPVVYVEHCFKSVSFIIKLLSCHLR